MDKQAMLKEIFDNAVTDEFEKVSAKTMSMSALKKMTKAIRGSNLRVKKAPYKMNNVWDVVDPKALVGKSPKPFMKKMTV